MLPPEFRTAEVERLQKIVDGVSEFNMVAFPPLTREDICLLGVFIQAYNFIDLNLRRCIETFVRSGKLSGDVSGKYLKLRDKELVPTIKGVVHRMPENDEDIEDTLGKLQEIEFRRPFRNLFAHWAARKLPNNEDAIIFLSKYEADGVQVLGDAIKFDNLAHAIIPLPDLRGLCIHIGTYEEWIALKCAEWHSRYIK